MNSLKITVVTVCYNEESTIDRTIHSVVGQTYPNIEYLILDGASTDTTWERIKTYKDAGNIRMWSQKDSGLYNAMNKAIDLASGEYIIFMNSGDVFYDNRTIEHIVPHLHDEIVYGGVIRRKKGGDIIEKYHGKHIVMRLLLQGRMMCHQSMFTKLDTMKKYRFDEDFKISADYDFVVRAQHDKCTMKYVDQIISVVENIAGISSSIKNMEIMRLEDDKSLKENFPLFFYLLRPIKSVVRFFKRRLIERPVLKETSDHS